MNSKHKFIKREKAKKELIEDLSYELWSKFQKKFRKKPNAKEWKVKIPVPKKIDSIENDIEMAFELLSFQSTRKKITIFFNKRKKNGMGLFYVEAP